MAQADGDSDDQPTKFRGSKLDAFRALFLEEPDAEIARRAGVHPETVRTYRIRHDIAPFRAANRGPVAAPRPREPEAAVDAPARRGPGRPRKVEPEPHEAALPAEKKAPLKQVAAEKVTPPLRKGGPSSPIDGYFDLLGQVPDSEIAVMAGVTRAAVYQYRRHRGIALQGQAPKPAKPAKSRPALVDEPEAPPAPVAAEAPSAPRVAETTVATPVKSRAFMYITTLRRGEVDTTYGVVGTDIADAARRALAAVGSDGRLLSIVEHMEALV
jgi:hypothetical protein